MAFTSQFSAQFTGLVLDRVQTVLERDTNTALAAIDASLPAVVDFKTPTPLTTNFPAVFLEPDLSSLVQSKDDSYIEGEHTLLINIAIADKDPAALKVAIVKYVRALDQVIRSMSFEDLTGGVTSAIGPPSWEVLEHRYGPFRANDQTIYRKDAQLVMAVQILER